MVHVVLVRSHTLGTTLPFVTWPTQRTRKRLFSRVTAGLTKAPIQSLKSACPVSRPVPFLPVACLKCRFQFSPMEVVVRVYVCASWRHTRGPYKHCTRISRARPGAWFSATLRSALGDGRVCGVQPREAICDESFRIRPYGEHVVVLLQRRRPQAPQWHYCRSDECLAPTRHFPTLHAA